MKYPRDLTNHNRNLHCKYKRDIIKKRIEIRKMAFMYISNGVKKIGPGPLVRPAL